MRNIYLVLHKKISYYILLMHSYTIRGTAIYINQFCVQLCMYIYASLYKTIYLYALYRAWQRLSTNYIYSTFRRQSNFIEQNCSRREVYRHSA